MFRYSHFKIVINILFFIVFAIIEWICFNSIETNKMPFSEHLVVFLNLNLGYKYTSLFKVASHMLPVIFFGLTSGINLYNDWSLENVYTIIRYSSRVKIYFKRICDLLVKSFLFSVAYLFILILIYNYTPSDYHSYKIEYIIGMIVVYSAQLFAYSILFSLISMKFGTSYGFFITVLYFLISIKTSLYIIEYHCSIADILGIASFTMELLHLIKSETVLANIILSAIIQIFISTLIGYVIIKRSDIGLIDKETE